MTELRDQLIAIKFKPVPGGYLYRAPYQLGLGKVTTYLVNEEQKAELIDAVIPQHPWRRSTALVATIIAAPIFSAFVVYWLSPHANPTTADTLAMLALTSVLVLAGFLVLRWWTLSRLKPLLDRLQRTDQSFTMADQRATMAKTMSVKMLKISTIACAFSAVLMLAGSFVGLRTGQANAYISLVSGCLMLGLAVYYGRQLIARRKSSDANAA